MWRISFLGAFFLVPSFCLLWFVLFRTRNSLLWHSQPFFGYPIRLSGLEKHTADSLATIAFNIHSSASACSRIICSHFTAISLPEPHSFTFIIANYWLGFWFKPSLNFLLKIVKGQVEHIEACCFVHFIAPCCWENPFASHVPRLSLHGADSASSDDPSSFPPGESTDIASFNKGSQPPPPETIPVTFPTRSTQHWPQCKKIMLITVLWSLLAVNPNSLPTSSQRKSWRSAAFPSGCELEQFISSDEIFIHISENSVTLTKPSRPASLDHLHIDDDFVAETASAVLNHHVQNVVVPSAVIQGLCVVQHSYEQNKRH